MDLCFVLKQQVFTVSNMNLHHWYVSLFSLYPQVYSGFVRLALEDTALFTQIKGTLTAGDNPACELLSNNLLAGESEPSRRV